MPSLREKIGVEPGEGRLVAAGAATLALLGWADVSIQNASEALFWKRIGTASLPLAYLASAALLVVTTALVARALGRVRRSQALPVLLLALAGLLLPLDWGVRRDEPEAVVVLLVVAQQFKALGLLVFWVAMGDLLHGRQAKRLFAPLMAGLTSGSIVGSLASDPVSRMFGVDGVLGAAVVALTLGAACTLPLRRRAGARLDRGLGVRGARALAPEAAHTARGPRLGALWRESALFRLLVVVLICSGILGPMLQYQFAFVASAATPGEGRLLQLLAWLRGGLHGAVLVAQLGLSSRIYRRIGVPLAVMLSPLAYLAGFGGLALQLSLPVGIAAWSTARFQENAVADPGLRVLFSLFPEALRARATALLEGPVKRSGAALGNVLVLGILALGPTAWVSYAALPIAAGWLGAGVALRRRYPSLLVEASEALAGSAPEASPALLDASTVQRLAPELAAGEPRRFRAALALVSEAPTHQAVPALARAAAEAGPERRAALVHALDRILEAQVGRPLPRGDAAEPLVALLEDASLREADRADVVQAFGRLAQCEGGCDDAEQRLRHALTDRAPAVRLAARAALARLGAPDAPGASLEDELREVVEHGAPPARRTAREELRALLLCGEPGEDFDRRLAMLTRLLDDGEDPTEVARALADVAERHGEAARPAAPDLLARREEERPLLRAALLRFVGHAGLREQAGWVVPHLASPQPVVARAAREALLALGAGAAEALLIEHAYGSRRTRDAILAVVRDLPVGGEVLRELYRREVTQTQEALLRLHVLRRGAPSPLLIQRLEERVEEGVHTALLFLTAIHDDGRIADLGLRLRHARTERERAIVIEALESLLPPEERGRLVPLVEHGAPQLRADAVSESLGVRPPSLDQAWNALREDPDDLTRELAWSTPPPREPQPAPGAGPVALAARLRTAPIFAHLGTRPLLDLAKRVTLESHAPGAVIYREGEPGRCLFVVCEGEVALARRGVPIAGAGPGETFGGIGVLDGEPRAEDARSEGGATVLRIDREDLFPLMEDQPSVAIAICHSLAGLVRDLTGRASAPVPEEPCAPPTSSST